MSLPYASRMTLSRHNKQERVMGFFARFTQLMFLKSHLHSLKSREERLRRAEIMAKHAAAQELSDAQHHAREREFLVREAQQVSAEIFMVENRTRG